MSVSSHPPYPAPRRGILVWVESPSRNRLSQNATDYPTLLDKTAVLWYDEGNEN